MKRLLLLSFDLIRDGEAPPSLAIASILAHLRSQPQHGTEYLCDFRSINLLDRTGIPPRVLFDEALRGVDFESLTHVAVGAYIWGESRTNQLIHWIRERGFRGEVILGGYQISYTSGDEPAILPQLRDWYPDCRRFVRGYAEESLLMVLLAPGDRWLYQEQVAFENLASPILTGDYPIEPGQAMVRMETQRGCPYRCTFCAHRDVATGRVHKMGLDRTAREFARLSELGVGKINVLDPVFNGGPRAIEILQHAEEARTTAKLSLQCRFENLTVQFLDALDGLDVDLEFGVQTVIPDEASRIERPNNLQRIEQALRELVIRAIPFEVSLIYGLPGQTLASFQQSIDWLQARGVDRIKAWPLKLLRGTKLADQKEIFGFSEELIGEYDIPLVTSSHSFNRREWEAMKAIADSLLPTGRI